MEVVQKPIGQLHSDPNNARKHDPKNIQAIKGSLAKFKQQKPIVITKDNIVLAGNGTLQAARELDWQHIDCVVTDLESFNATAFALADNRTAELAEWDEGVLAETLKSLDDFDFDIGDIGFDDSFLPDEEPTQGNIEDDLIPDTEDNEFGVQLGDVWKLGEHRLMCGDSTKKENVELLMADEKADMVFTDPPYGMNLNTSYSDKVNPKGNWEHKPKNYGKIIGDNNDFCAKFILDNFSNTKEIFLFGGDYYSHTLPSNSGSWIVWDKTTNESLDKTIGSCFELCWSKQKHKRKIARIKWRGIYGTEKEDIRTRVHPAQKPVLLIEWFFESWGKDKTNIVDLFLGSGSTLIACEKTNRKCYGMELDPHYCSVIIKRWQDFTGQTASKVA